MTYFMKLKQLLMAPVFEDEAKTYQTALLNRFLWIILASFPIIIGIAPLFTSHFIIYWTILVIELFVLVGLHVLLRRGKVRWAGIGLLSSMWIVFLLSAMLAGGVQTPAMNSLILVVIAAGLLLGGQESFVFAGMSVFAGALMAYAEHQHWLPSSYVDNTVIAAWIGLAINYSFGAILLFITINAGKRTLRHSYQSAQALAETNRSLQASEANYRYLMEQAADSIFIVGAEIPFSQGGLSHGFFVDINTLALGLLGYTREEVLQLRMKDVVMMDDVENVKVAAETLCAGQTILIERQLRHKDGHLIPAEVSARILADGRLQAIVRDISERKQREAESQTEFARFRALVDYASDAFFWHDENGHIIEVNRQACESLGYTREELIGMPPYKLDGNIDRDFYLSIRDRIEGGNMLAFETSHRRKDGSMFPVEVRLRVYNDGGKNIGISLARDITQRKLVEKERQANLRFLENLDRINRALQGTNDLNTILHDVLEAVIDIFGCDRAWLLFPCVPDAPNWSIPMECTRPEYPGMYSQNLILSNIPEMAELMQMVLDAENPVQLGPGAASPVPLGLNKEFQVQSWMAFALHPKTSPPYLFGLHQCSAPHVWGSHEVTLFQEIGRRLEEVLSSMLVYQELQESERRLDAAQQLARVGYWELDLEVGVVTLSKMTEEILEVTPRSAKLNLIEWAEWWEKKLLPETSEKFIQALMGTVQTGQPFSLEYIYPYSDGTDHFMFSRGELVKNGQGNSLHLFGMTQDITQLRRAQQALEERENLYRALFEQASDGVALHHAITGEAIAVNQAMADMMECEISDIIGTGMVEGVMPDEQDDTHEKWRKILTDGQLEPYERRLITHKGNLRYFEITASTIYDRQTGVPRYIQAVLRDITERKQTEAQIKAALLEKEILLKEIHHRVKNNLQVISSLLYLQSLKIQDQTMLELFRESRNRVSAMALVHEQLYQSENFARVDFGTYIRALVGSLFESYGVTETNITLMIETDNTTLDVHTAIPCGLLVSEMVSNALKYAFPSGKGEITITLFAEAGTYFLQVRDNGIGLPETSMIRPGSLGLQLIERLVAQIGGTLTRSGPPGTAYAIHFT